MGEDVLQKVLERAFSDQQFRSRLEAALESALESEGYVLDLDQLQQLRVVLDEGKDGFATGLDQRLSQSGVSLSPQALLRAKSKKAEQEESLVNKGFQAKTSGGAAGKPKKDISAKKEDGHPKNAESGEPYDQDEPDYEIETD